MAPFTIFEVTPLAIVLVAWGMLYLAAVRPPLLPERQRWPLLSTGRG
jgi:hypothetical protein